MSKSRILIIIAVLFLVVVLLAVIKYSSAGKGILISPGVRKIFGNPAITPAPIPTPIPPSYQPPKEIQYNSGTDLNQELESIDPQVLDEDFN